MRSSPIIALALALCSCAGPHGRVTSARELARFEGGGSLSTLWYYGSDSRFHYFRHLWKNSTPYRLPTNAFHWNPEERFDGYDEGILITNQISEHIETQALRGVAIAQGTERDAVLEILSSRGGKDPDEEWKVDSKAGVIRIRKTAGDGKVYPPGAGVEYWRRGQAGEWEAVATA